MRMHKLNLLIQACLSYLLTLPKHLTVAWYTCSTHMWGILETSTEIDNLERVQGGFSLNFHHKIMLRAYSRRTLCINEGTHYCVIIYINTVQKYYATIINGKARHVSVFFGWMFK